MQQRRGNASDWTSANPTLAEGEIGVELDTHKWKIGDGNTPWVSLPYVTQGTQGIPGPQGPTGPQGATGPQGPQGPLGVMFDFRVNGTLYVTLAATTTFTTLSARNGDGAAEATIAYAVAGTSKSLPFTVNAGQELAVTVTGMTGTHRVSFGLV
jgi:hypothetical protein